MNPQEPTQQGSETNSDDEHSVSQQPSVATVRNIPMGETRIQEAVSSRRPQQNDRTLELVPVPKYSLRRIKQRHTIRLVGTHTSESSTDQPCTEPQKCLPYDKVVAVRDESEPPVRCTVLENVRGFVQEMEKMDRGKLDYYMERMVGRTSSEVGQRQVIEIARVEQSNAETNENEDSKVKKKPEKENGVPLEKKSSSLLRAERENAMLAERFKVILELFDNFTKNLESVELRGPKVPTHRDTSNKRRRDPSPKSVRYGKRARSSDDCPENQPKRVRCSRYEEYYGKDCPRVQQVKEQALRDTGFPHRQTAETFPYSLDRDERIDIATTMSGIALTPSGQLLTEPESSEVLAAASPMATQSTVSCQTSNFKLIPDSYQGESKPIETAASQPHTVVTIEHENDEDITRELITQQREKSVERQTLVEYHPPTPIPDPQIVLDSLSVGPLERTFHTIHIDASSSPTSSVMRRPPLCSRFWNVITDFCAAVCLCLQVNKECLFCVGFVFAFVVSASFLSAFFYRTLNMPLPVYHQHNIAVEQPAPIHIEFLESNENIRDGAIYL